MLKLRLWVRLLRSVRVVEVELRRRLRAEFGETLPRFDVMAALARQRAGMTMTEVSRFLMVSNGNVTGIVDRLVAEGMVVRRSYAESPPRVEYELTEKGDALKPIIDEMRRFGHDWLGCEVHSA